MVIKRFARTVYWSISPIAPSAPDIFKQSTTANVGAVREANSLFCALAFLFMFPRHWFSRKAAANLAVSHHVLVRHALPRSSVIYHGIDGPLGEGSASPPEASAKLRFAYVGRFVPEK